ncbi:Signal-regulatory protein beta-2 [Nibea albiflora]|uniref:Signal-regulatory protein beta-2 n=1 Tax=Nibea albiflora TaxID=240163 RepID=A0ACB7ENP9_NIBAL|nr:Signal-regulatory protein beta-2 [Nibea albiflora]
MRLQSTPCRPPDASQPSTLRPVHHLRDFLPLPFPLNSIKLHLFAHAFGSPVPYSDRRCSDDLIFDMKTVGVGDDVNLTCTRQKSSGQGTLFWIRLVSLNFPEFLGGTYSFDYKGVNKTPMITKQEPGTFLLQIHDAKFSDTGVYYCIKIDQLQMTFLNGTFLRIKGPEPDITAVIQVPLSDPVRPGDSVTLQCSVLSDSENKTCPGEHSVYWFRAGSDESHPSLIYAHGNSGDECERSPQTHSPQKCVYSFSKNVSSSDAGTYYCAVVTCGEILFGNGTKLEIEAFIRQDPVLFLVCAALALSLIVIGFLVCAIKKKSCDCCNTVLTLQAKPASGDQQSRQTSSEFKAALFWIRLVSGKMPEFLGGTYSFDYDGVNKSPHMTTKQEPGTFLLQIHETKLSDTGLYYCIKINELSLTFLQGTFLRIKAGSDESHPSLIYAHGNSGDECERSPQTHSPQKCVYSFSKSVTSSDDGTYYCAVATCGEILFGNGTKLEIEAFNRQTVLFLVCAALALSLIVIGFLVCAIKKKSCDCCNVSALNRQDPVLFLLCAALALSLIIIALLIHTIKKKSGGFCNFSALNRQDPVLFLLCAALALSLIVIAFLIYTIKEKSGGFCNAFNRQDPVLFLLCAALALSLIVIGFLVCAIKKKSGGFCNEPHTDMTAVPPSYRVCPGGSVTVTLQSSFLSDSENKTCPGEKTVCCFRSKSDGFQPSFTVIRAIGAEEQNKYRSRLSTKNCTYSFSKNISFLDAGTYCCAVATYEEIFCGDKSKPNTEAVNIWDSQKNIIILSLLCAALAISLIIIAFLIIYSIMKLQRKSCACCNAAVSLQANTATASADHQSQQTDEASLVYSAPNFTKRKVVKAGTRDAKTDEEETLYTNVRVRLTA